MGNLSVMQGKNKIETAAGHSLEELPSLLPEVQERSDYQCGAFASFGCERGKRMYTDSRDEGVKLLKRLWTSQPTVCPKCGGAELVHLHKKAKKSDCDWTCPACGEIYRTIHMLKELPDRY